MILLHRASKRIAPEIAAAMGELVRSKRGIYSGELSDGAIDANRVALEARDPYPIPQKDRSCQAGTLGSGSAAGRFYGC
jgi:hypothetical protein